jgi:hypothetical protein
MRRYQHARNKPVSPIELCSVSGAKGTSIVRSNTTSLGIRVAPS